MRKVIVVICTFIFVSLGLIGVVLILSNQFENHYHQELEVGPSIFIHNNNQTINSLVYKLNSSHWVISGDVDTSITLQCLGRAPVMWTMDSLEHQLVQGVYAERIIPTINDFYNVSSYKYSMEILLVDKLLFNKGPSQFTCMEVHDPTKHADITLLWESQAFSYFQEYRPGSSRNLQPDNNHVIYWNSVAQDDGLVTIPCYTNYVDKTMVELYRKEVDGTRTKLDPDPDPETSTSTLVVRFENYIGYFLNASYQPLDDSGVVYECYELTKNSNNKRLKSTYTIVKLEVGEVVDVQNLLGSESESSHAAAWNHLAFNHVSNTSNWIAWNARGSRTENLTLSLIKSDAERDIYLSNNISCCVTSSSYNINGVTDSSEVSANNMLMYNNGDCRQPLLCLTRKHMSKRTKDENIRDRRDQYFNTSCRTLDTYVQTKYVILTQKKRKSWYYQEGFYITPRLLVCALRRFPESNDRKEGWAPTSFFYERKLDNTDFSRRRRIGNYEIAYLMSPGSLLNYVTLESIVENHERKLESRYLEDDTQNLILSNESIIPKLTFYELEVVVFRCRAAPFYFAAGIIWELELNNGKRQLISGNKPRTTKVYGQNDAEIKIGFTSQVGIQKLFCHVPLWNSSDWVTKSVNIELKPSKAPTTVSGQSVIYENVTFTYGDSITIKCDDFVGAPSPTIHWDYNGLHEKHYTRNPINDSNSKSATPYEFYHRHFDYEDVMTWIYACKDWFNYYSTQLHFSVEKVFPTIEIHCTVSNHLGVATKYFRIKAIVK